MYETNEKTVRLLKQKIDEVVNKGDISPSEMECVEKAYETISLIKGIEAMDEEFGYGNSFARERSMRRGGGQSRGQGQGSSNGYWPVHYRDDEESYRRGRGADGRYVSRESRGRGGSYNEGYSGHSVNDRMIASLEYEMDNAESEYDRQKIQEEIRRLREAKN